MSQAFTPAHPAPYQHYAPVIQVSTPPILGLEDLSPLLKKSIPAILADRSRAPGKLPPACTPPGTKQPLWLLTDVLAWLATHREPGEDRPPTSRAPKAADPLAPKEDGADEGARRRRGRPTKAAQIARATAGIQKGGAQ